MNEQFPSKKELTKTFEEVLRDYQVLGHETAEQMIEDRVAELRKAQEEAEEASTRETEENVSEFGEEPTDLSFTPSELEETLPDDVWAVVRTYLAASDVEAMETETPEEEVSKSVLRENLKRVAGQQAAALSKEATEPSHAGTVEEGSSMPLPLHMFYGEDREPSKELGKAASESPGLVNFYDKEEAAE